MLYGIDMLEHFDDQKKITYKYPTNMPTSVIIVEGEIDKLSLDQAGLGFGLSVPEGAPSQVSESGSK